MKEVHTGKHNVSVLLELEGEDDDDQPIVHIYNDRLVQYPFAAQVCGVALVTYVTIWVLIRRSSQGSITCHTVRARHTVSSCSTTRRRVSRATATI